MIIIFGWEKRVEVITTAFQSYCYNCQKETDWLLGLESEWVTFFDIGVLRFKKTDFIMCDSCSDDFDLNKRAMQKLRELRNTRNQADRDWILSGFGKLIEEHQLANKNEAQKNFILSTRQCAQQNKAED